MLKKTTKKKRNPNSKSKQKSHKPKPLKTLHDSHSSLLEDPHNPTSISDLFKNEALKKKPPPLPNASQINFSSTINNYTSVYTVISSIHAQKPQKTKSAKNITKPSGQTQKKKGPQKAKSKSKLTTEQSKQPKKKRQLSKHEQQKQSQRLESYELIPPSKNSLNSEIVFSTEDTKREQDWEVKRREESARVYDSLVRVSHENLINNNRLLRSTIKQEFKKKNQAATKIQKVFRGYLTRKILQKYIKQEQQKLYGLLQNYKSSSNNKPVSSRAQSKGSNYEMEFFSNRTQSKVESPKTFKDEESINLSKVNASNYRFEESKVTSERTHSNRFFDQRDGEIVNCEDEVVSSEEMEMEEQERSGEEEEEERSVEEDAQECESDEDSQVESQSSQEVIAYRHQQVIYNGAQIQQYLESSSSQEQLGQVPKCIAHSNIIFQTNEEHIQSRKNSLLSRVQHPTNTKHKAKHLYDHEETSEIIFYEPDEQFSGNFDNHEFVDQDLIKTSKVNSITQSQKGSIKSSETVSPKTKNQILQAEMNLAQQPSERTSKKQCKKVTIKTHPASNPSVSNSKPQSFPLTLEDNTEPLNTIKNPLTQKYSPPNLTSKQAFMDTISYNSEFKAKHRITTEEQISKRKDSMKKKKIYYFSDESDQERDPKPKCLTPSSGRGSDRQLDNPNQLEKLKTLEMERWDQVIRLMNSQLKDMTQAPAKSKQFEFFIKQVMDLSLKNKEILKEMISHDNSFNKSHATTVKNSRIDQILLEKESEDNQEKLQKWKDFKDTLSSGRRKSITEQDIAVFKPNSRILLSNKNPQKQPLENNWVGSPKSKSFFKQPKLELKQKLNKLEAQNFHLSESQTRDFTLMNFQNDQIDQMLKIRQEMLQKRECEELTKLNEKLIKKELSQKEFLQQLKGLTDAFQLEKHSIDKAREDISKGYNAAVKLIREAFCDAKKIGYKLPLSKSSDSYKLNKHLGFGVLTGLNHVIIDELNSKDQSFPMRHIRETLVQSKEGRELKCVQKMVKPSESESICEASPQQAQQTQPKQFTRSQGPQPLSLLSNSSKNYSQSSSSIINNLAQSQSSFKDHYFHIETSPKHQSIQTPESSAKSNIFTGNDHEFDDMSEESSEIQFSEEELKRFCKAQPYDPSIADMNRNLMIGKDFFQMQMFADSPDDTDAQASSNINQNQPENLRMRLYREVYEIQQHSIDSTLNDFSHLKSKDPKVQFIAQKSLDFLIFQIATELLMKPLFSEKFLQPKRQEMFGIKRVSDDCRKDFVRFVQNLMPNKQQIFAKINQNISPLPKELLKCMRIDFSEDEEEENDEEYEEIGKYEMILDQEMCNMAIEKYHEKVTEQKQSKQQIDLLTGNNIESLREQFSGLWPEPMQEKTFAYLQQRQKFVSNRKQHCESIRWQFINMELHCLFDAWNEQIIELKNNHNGFSGIGLNELTLSMVDRNKKVRESAVEEIVQMSKFKLMKVLNYEEEIIEEINTMVWREMSVEESQGQEKSLTERLHESWERFSWVYEANKDVEDELDTEEESRWVYYADEALSYGLQLVYLVQEELFSELARDLRKLTIKGQFV